MFIFAIILICWANLGYVGVLNCKTPHTDYEMLIFMGFVPFIPILAKVFQIL